MLNPKTALIILFFLSALITQAQSSWELKSEEDNIKIYTRNLPDKKFLEFKASTTVEGSMHGVMTLIKSVDTMNGWMKNFKVNELLETKSFWHQVSYHEVQVPLLQNRDVVLEVKLNQDATNNSMKIEMRSLPEFIPESDKHTRIKELYGHWMIQPVGNGKMHIEYSMYIDPGKSIPSWLYNMRIKKDPQNTLTNIRRLLKEDKQQQAYFAELEPKLARAEH